MGNTDLSVTDHAVLGILAEGPNHGFALARQLDPDSEVGRVFSVRRPLVYRALDRLVDNRLAEPVTTEQAGGPKRVVHRITPKGRRRLQSWLNRPVRHVRDMRIEFLLKLSLLRRSDRTPIELIRKQRAALDPTLTALEEPATDPEDHVESWRRHNALAAVAFLDELEATHSGDSI